MKKLLVALLLSTTAFCHEVVDDKSDLVIDTPALAERTTRKIRLDNGLEALLISDPDATESGAALAVNVGSWEDPADRPGMAHFVEHLLFLGTEKYPEESGYTRYLDEHGGTRNAFTMSDRTVYMFSVNNDGFSGALDRFGQFFVAPLFTPSGVGRECKAIHQEYCRNVPLDPWRVMHVKMALANPDHPFHRFSIGNSTTLDDISQDELKAWYRSHYSSHLMHLVVYSTADLDTMEEEVVQVFSEVKRVDHTPQISSEPMMRAENFSKLIAVDPVQDLQALELSWELPRFFGQDTTVHADKLVSHVLGHEGETSLLAQLKREGLAESLGAGSHRAGHDQELFTLSIQLTAKGIQQHEKVIERCFQAIASLKESGIPRYVYDEVVDLEMLRYRFQSRKPVFEMVTDLAMRLVDEPIDTFPKQSLIPTRYAPKKVNEMLAELTPNRCQFSLIAPPFLTKCKPTAREKWLNVDYTTVDLSPEKLEKWAALKPHKEISIPRPNPFLPTTLAVEGQEGEPELLVENESATLYTCTDGEFLVPEISWHFTIKTPEVTPETMALADLYCHAVDEALNTTSYEALLAGLNYSLKATDGGLELTLTGYGERAQKLLGAIAYTMKTVRPTKQQFALYQDQLMRTYFNTGNASPLKQGGEKLSSLLYLDYASCHMRSNTLRTTNYKHFTAFCDKLLKKNYIEATLYGNTPTTKVWPTLERTLVATPFPKELHHKKEVTTLDEKPTLLKIASDHPANALILTTDCGAFTFKKRAAQEILTKGLEEPFFSELRTKQQTAYLVTNWAREVERHLYSFFAIQSSSHDTRDLLARFELFLESSLQNMEQSVIPQERFEAIQTALIEKLDHPADSLSKKGELLHALAYEYNDFDWLEKRKAALDELTYPEFLAFAEEFLGKSNPRRLALVVNGALPPASSLQYQEAK